MVKESYFSRLKSKRKSDSAVAAIEMALVLPLLMTFLYGVISYGYIFSFQQAITQATAEAARAAAITPVATDSATRASKASAAVNRVLSDYNSQCGSGGLTCSTTIAACSNDATRQCATVTVNYAWGSSPKIPKFPLLPVPNNIKKVSIVEVS